MARYLRDKKTGQLLRIEVPAREMAEKVLGVELEDLARWTKAIPPLRGEGEDAIYTVRSRDELDVLRKRAKLLRTNMNEKAVANVEKAGLLDAYADLAEDCPPGITAHVWRSYGVVVLMQVRYNRMIGAEELAERAGLKRREGGKLVPDVEMAEKHLRLLTRLGHLTPSEEGRWEHQGLPKGWVGGEDA